MPTRHEDDPPTDATRSARHLTVCVADKAVDAKRILPLSVLTRLCSNERPSRIRQGNVYRSHVIVVLDGDVPVGFAAYKPTLGRVRVAHELCVPTPAPGDPTQVTQALLNTLETGAITAGCSRLCVVLAASSPLRLILERAGYHVSLSSTDLTWLEKSLVGDADPLQSA